MDLFKYWRTKRYLDSVGEGFCLEKWNNNTLHLGTGTEHGCHHVAPKKIPLEEVEQDPYALFNHSHKKSVRQEMLDGKQPAECAYCWRSKGLQDRIIQSSKPHNWNYRTINSTQRLPTYLELSFGNTCNLACAYCGPSFSSKWASEIKQHGDYSVGLHKGFAVANNKANVYTEALASIWDTVIENLEVLKITGGEPLLSDKFFPFLQKIHSECDLTINTGLGVPRDKIKQFVELIKHMPNLSIAVSGESTGLQAEYSRNGLVYKDFVENLKYLRDHLPNAKFEIMSVYNVLCLETFVNFLEHVKNITPFHLHISELEKPNFLHHSLCNVNKQFHLDYTKRFHSGAYTQLKTILTKEHTQPDPAKFFRFVEEYDKRRNTNFYLTYPQLGKNIWITP
jgi:organic radical activating enzyme